MSQGVNDEYLTTGQAAKVLKVSTSSIRKLIERGLLQFIRPLGTRRLILKSDLEKYVEDHPDLQTYVNNSC